MSFVISLLLSVMPSSQLLEVTPRMTNFLNRIFRVVESWCGIQTEAQQTIWPGRLWRSHSRGKRYLGDGLLWMASWLHKHWSGTMGNLQWPEDHSCAWAAGVEIKSDSEIAIGLIKNGSPSNSHPSRFWWRNPNICWLRLTAQLLIPGTREIKWQMLWPNSGQIKTIA